MLLQKTFFTKHIEELLRSTVAPLVTAWCDKQVRAELCGHWNRDLNCRLLFDASCSVVGLMVIADPKN